MERENGKQVNKWETEIIKRAGRRFFTGGKVKGKAMGTKIRICYGADALQRTGLQTAEIWQ